MGSSGYFRLDQHQDQLVFCNDAEIQNNARFQMIQLRRAKVQEFKNYRMIPILDKEVPKGIIEARTKRFVLFMSQLILEQYRQQCRYS
jgi:coiled-coil and C2 domain-containing protein 2A